ncbi:hypothetical protein [Pseudomonas sp. Marseille-Q5115]|uniref:hypothetical protein n=1 Tax=Pseudomonas sp. Marseille-Q5115 TaxID=2866593 RepID=UPI001CE3EA2E|nr:hypothetical protein [Pseudomonas sp. Marseille-Q5115]
MNAVREAVPQGNNSVSPQMAGPGRNAQRCAEGRGADPRRAIADRYPAGLISDAELEALLGIVKA